MRCVVVIFKSFGDVELQTGGEAKPDTTFLRDPRPDSRASFVPVK
jgi:hypothetical protein